MSPTAKRFLKVTYQEASSKIHKEDNPLRSLVSTVALQLTSLPNTSSKYYFSTQKKKQFHKELSTLSWTYESTTNRKRWRWIIVFQATCKRNAASNTSAIRHSRIPTVFSWDGKILPYYYLFHLKQDLLRRAGGCDYEYSVIISNNKHMYGNIPGRSNYEQW